MALTMGVNQGLVTESPVADPTANYNENIDNYVRAIKVTSPVGSNKITQMGWWCNNETQEANFEFGLYSHHAGNDKPDARLFHSITNAKGTNAGWKTAVVDWAMVAETIYWIAVQVDDTATSTKCDYERTSDRTSYKGSTGGLSNPYPAGSTESIWPYAIYAKYEASVTYSELAGACAGTGSGSGDLELSTYSSLAGTCAGVGGGSGDLGSTSVSISEHYAYKRLVVVGNNQVWIEDI